MSDIILSTSEYQTGTIDSATVLVNNVSPIDARHVNGPATAIIQLETILGSGTVLKGSKADLGARLAVTLAGNGKLNDFSATTKTTFPITVAEGGTGNVAANMGKRILGNTVVGFQFVDFIQSSAFTGTSTFTVPAGITSFYVEVFGAGGGGGGGGGGVNDGGGGVGGGGNGARGRPGGYAAQVFTAVTPGATYPVVIGAAGAAGAGGASSAVAGGNGVAGGTGGTSSFNTTIAATGGAGGGSGNGATIGANGASASSELTADGIASGGSILFDGHGGMGGAGGAGGSVAPTDGVTGAAGRAGLVIIWY